MSLGVTVIDYYTQEEIECGTILIDDSISTIKDKLFISGGMSMYPNLIKVELNNEIITDNSCLLFNKSFLEEGPNILYITNVIDVIGKEYDAQLLYSELNSHNFLELQEKLIKENGFTDLKEKDLEFVIKMNVYQYDQDVYSYLKEEIDENIKSVVNIHEKKKKTKSNTLNDLYKYAYKFHREDYDTFADFNDFDFTEITVKIIGNNYEPGIKGKYIKLEQIFNIFELSEKMPFIAYGKSGHSDPYIKIYNKINISEKNLKNWILNEKKKYNIITYKKIIGIVIKYQITSDIWATFNIMDNGIIYIKLTNENLGESLGGNGEDKSLNTKINMIKTVTDEIIGKLNLLQGVFTQSKRINQVSESNLTIESLTSNITTNFLIQRNKFSNILNNKEISENIFEIKDLLSSDIISLYYKKFGGTLTTEERKGITVNIRDNPYKLDSSIITVYSSVNITQLTTIIKQIILLSLISLATKSTFIESLITDTKQKIKDRSQIKILRKQGVEIQSTKCQKPRQPILNELQNPLESSYILDYNNKKYICPSKNYPYPGFTNDNIVCCFKKDQRHTDKYIRNMKPEEFEIMIQPSNFKIKIKEPNKDAFTTIAIKIVSDYTSDFNEETSMGRYYYLSQTNELVAIANESLINDIIKNEQEANKEMKDIWLEIVPLSRIKSEPPKNICNNPPKMNIEIQNLNDRCKHHSKNKIYGYNIASYPCCFDKERDIFITKKTKVYSLTDISTINKQHIITSDKILDHQRIGVLFSGINKLLNELIEKEPNSVFYRMGVVQNKAALLNAVLLGINNKISGDIEVIVNNSSDFRKFIANYLTGNEEFYYKLNNGNLNLKYTLQEYISLIDNVNTIFDYPDYIDLLQKITRYNIIILDIPYKQSESKKIIDINGMRLVCNNVDFNENHPYIVLLKRQNTYENIIMLSKTQIRYSFKQNEPIIKFLLDYYKNSCIKENVYPETYNFDELYKNEEIINVLNNTKHKILAQIINDFNKVEYLLTKSGVMIPIQESGIIDNLNKIKFDKLINSKKFLSLDLLVTNINEINKLLKKSNYTNSIKIFGITSGEYPAIFTNFGQFIPIKQIQEDFINKYTLLDFKYHPFINKYLKSNESNDFNEQENYINHNNGIKKVVYQIKIIFSKFLNKYPKLKEYIIKTNKQPLQNKNEKINKIVRIFYKIAEKIGKFKYNQNFMDFIFKQIANEITNDNIENLLLNDLIVSDIFNPNQIITRESESILLNINDIKKWISKNQK